MPDFWALKFATWVASLHSLNWCKTGLLSTKPVAFASEPIRDQPADFQTVAQSHPYTVILQVTKSGLDVVTMNNDWCHMKVGCLVNICMLKVSCRFDLTPLLELQIHSAISGYVHEHKTKIIYWAVQKNLVKGCRQTLDYYCVSCELLSASIADALWFVNMVCLPLIAERNTHEICLTQEC